MFRLKPETRAAPMTASAIEWLVDIGKRILVARAVERSAARRVIVTNVSFRRGWSRIPPPTEWSIFGPSRNRPRRAKKVARRTPFL